MADDWQPDFEQLPDFERLFDEHQSMVFSLALRMTGDRGLTEEIAQDVFMELDRHITKIESAQHAIFWLRRVTMSRSTDALRRRRARGFGQWVEIDESHGAREPEALLATLPEAQRAALILRYQEDLTPEEIAATLGAPLATVKSQLQRGLKLLRAKAESQLKEYIRAG
jgi:RNA polymerase sigma-70 factor (ECF subfamily)